VKFNVVIFNVVNCGRLFDASANAEINNSARPSFWHIDVWIRVGVSLRTGRARCARRSRSRARRVRISGKHFAFSHG